MQKMKPAYIAWKFKVIWTFVFIIRETHLRYWMDVTDIAFKTKHFNEIANMMLCDQYWSRLWNIVITTHSKQLGECPLVREYGQKWTSDWEKTMTITIIRNH